MQCYQTRNSQPTVTLEPTRMTSTYKIAVFEGDGIGHEITPPALELLSIACDKASTAANKGSGDAVLSLEYLPLEAGAETYQNPMNR